MLTALPTTPLSPSAAVPQIVDAEHPASQDAHPVRPAAAGNVTATGGGGAVDGHGRRRGGGVAGPVRGDDAAVYVPSRGRSPRECGRDQYIGLTWPGSTPRRRWRRHAVPVVAGSLAKAHHDAATPLPGVGVETAHGGGARRVPGRVVVQAAAVGRRCNQRRCGRRAVDRERRSWRRMWWRLGVGPDGTHGVSALGREVGGREGKRPRRRARSRSSTSVALANAVPFQ